MNQFLEWLRQIFSSWKFWIVIPPWDVGIRIRLGKHARALQPGAHWRLPFIDDITLVNTRLRYSTTPEVTLKSEEVGKSRVRAATIGYRVIDPLCAMQIFASPAIAVLMLAQAELARGLDTATCQESVTKQLIGKGIEIEFLRLVEDVEVPTMRLLQNTWSLQDETMYPSGQAQGERRY